MQKRTIVGIALATALGAATIGAVHTASAQMYGYGMMGPGYGQGMMGPNMMYGQGYGSGMMGPNMMYGQVYGPGMMGPGMMGPGMMYGQGYGPGMMGPGMMYGPGRGWGMHGPGWAGNQGNLNITVDAAKNFFGRWVAAQGNSRLKVGDVKEKDADTITVDIVTKDNSLVQRFLVNRHNGAFQAEEG